MTGQSKWANILHKKAKGDSKRSKVFTKIIQELTIAVREGGNDHIDNIKHFFTTRGSNMGTNSSVSFLLEGFDEETIDIAQEF